MKPSDQFLKLVEWSEEDQCYVGTCPGLMLGGIHGRNEAQVYKELCQAVDEWIKIQGEDQEPLPKATAKGSYSGKFVVRMDKSLHQALTVAALREGKSLNTYCVSQLQRAVRGRSVKQRSSTGGRSGSKRKSR
ncbi:MAG: toxin-antitoxin system HicB family antitoxin [Nitrospirales bacterium]|nr:toxin-antitoxin system HicB family antitoxin [Nitrospirales bacterium]